MVWIFIYIDEMITESEKEISNVGQRILVFRFLKHYLTFLYFLNGLRKKILAGEPGVAKVLKALCRQNVI